MAITILPIDADPATGLPKVTAQQYRQGRAAEHGGGSGRQLGLRSGFRVGTPSNVLTATSTTWTLGPCAAKLDVAEGVAQGGYDWANDSNFTGSGAQGVQAADSTNPRKDIVYIQVNDANSDGSGQRSAPLLYLAGTPGVNPQPPTLPARSFLVGTISVPVAGGGSPTVELNPARYVSAGAPVPVDLAARDALTKYDTLRVQRTDLPGRPVETWDGSRWTSGAEAVAYTPTWTGSETWGAGPTIRGVYWRNGNHVRVQAMIQAGAGTSLGLSPIAFTLPPGLTLGADFMATGSGIWNSSGTSGNIRQVLTAAGPGQDRATVWATPGTGEVQTPGNAGWGWGTGAAFHVWIEYKTDAA